MKITKTQLREIIRELIAEDWWSAMSAHAQQQYIKDHPDSDKAKSAKAAREKYRKEKPKHANLISKGIFPGSSQYKRMMGELKQSISGNKSFIKRVVLPMTKKSGIKSVRVKDLPATSVADDKQQMELTFDTDQETNDKFLALLKKKAGSKSAKKKRQSLNLKVLRELLKNLIVKELNK